MASGDRNLRLLIVSGNLALLRGHYQEVITALARAGVDVRIRYINEKLLDPEEFAESFRAAGADVDIDRLPRVERHGADALGLRLRELGNILRYTHPDYAGRTVLAERALLKTGPAVRRWGARITRTGARAPAIARRVAWIERAVPAPSHAVRLVAEHEPNGVVVVPVIRVPALVDYLKAAAAARAATAIWVQSWDNLTNKGLLHFTPDRVFVWNETQKQELSRYHGVPPDRVCTTGAQTFDHWFNGDPVPSRVEFCSDLGIDPGTPIVLYVASSKQIAPDEPAFFERWLRAVRSSSDALLASATILLRPHPTLAQAWQSRGFDTEPGVVVSPSTLHDQINSDPFRARYRGELHHATLAVGINTSAFIDAAIFGKPGCTVELPELFHGQRGTVHFDHLTQPGAELLRTAQSIDGHLEQLSELIRRDTYARDERSDAFVRSFVRPHGLDVRPADLFVQEMLALCREPTAISPPVGAACAVGVALARAAVLSPLLEGPRPLARKIRKRWAVTARRVKTRARRGAVRVAHAVAHRVPARPRRALRRVGARSAGVTDSDGRQLRRP
jgi:hypothetical protein